MKRNGIGRIIAGCSFAALWIIAVILFSILPGLDDETRLSSILTVQYFCIPGAVLFLIFGIRCYRRTRKSADTNYMCRSFNRKTDYHREMRECLMEFMLSYINDNPFAADTVVPIFSDAELIIRRLPEKEIAKTMRVNNTNVECCALNIVQNVAMSSIQQVSSRDFLSRTSPEEQDHAYELFNHINKLKLDKGYIDKQQYDDNWRVATRLAMKSPLGSWL